MCDNASVCVFSRSLYFAQEVQDAYVCLPLVPGCAFLLSTQVFLVKFSYAPLEKYCLQTLTLNPPTSCKHICDSHGPRCQSFHGRLPLTTRGILFPQLHMLLDVADPISRAVYVAVIIFYGKWVTYFNL